MFLKLLKRTLNTASTRMTTKRMKEISPSIKGGSFFIYRSFTSNKVPLAQTSSNDKFLLAFTCKPCGKRSSHAISKQAYNKGIVLVQCPSCENRHLIADNLDWFDQKGSSRNIEDILLERGETVKKTIIESNLSEEDLKFISEFKSSNHQEKE